LDPKFYDQTRREITPLQLDLVEGYAQGRVSRRTFMQRGALLGLSVPMLGAIMAACGGSSSSSSSSSASAPAASSGAPKTGGTIRVAIQTPAGPIDPVGMYDLGAYGCVAQTFEYLTSVGDNGDIAPGLAESWTPNADGTVWTFKIKSGVKWQSGGDLTVADIAATLDRVVASGNSGIKGVLDKGSTVADSADPLTAVVTLLKPNGFFPYLVSPYNPQTAITPADYTAGTTLDQRPDGTGPFKLSKFDKATGASFVRNDTWWGGKTPLDGVELQFFNDTGSMVNAFSGGSVDVIEQFDALGGDALLNDPNINLITIRATLHRQIWMRCDKGAFKDKRVRQAMAYTFDRQQMIDTLFKGKADIGNDHVIAPIYPYWDSTQPQRTQDIAKAKQLLADAGASGLKTTLHAAKLQEIPELAQLIQSGAQQAGFDVQLQVESLGTFYGAQWCPAKPADPPCSGAADFGIVDYGHRATPDVYLNAALNTGGAWNSSQYSSPDFDAAFVDFQKALDLDAHKAAAAKIQTILTEDTPIGVPFFFNYLGAYSKKFQGIKADGLGQMFFDKASQV
jgi:peptide/nickel transport system substrate-binding protein